MVQAVFERQIVMAGFEPMTFTVDGLALLSLQGWDLRLSVRLQVLIGSFYFEGPIAVTRSNAGNQTQQCLRRIQA